MGRKMEDVWVSITHTRQTPMSDYKIKKKKNQIYLVLYGALYFFRCDPYNTCAALWFVSTQELTTSKLCPCPPASRVTWRRDTTDQDTRGRTVRGSLWHMTLCKIRRVGISTRSLPRSRLGCPVLIFDLQKCASLVGVLSVSNGGIACCAELCSSIIKGCC